MKFWKFEVPQAADLERCLTDGSLSRSVSAAGLKDTFDVLLGKMRVGDGVVLATLVGDEARIVALGQVRALEPHRIQWAATSHTRFPDARGGLVNWQTKTAFEISSEPATRYGLHELVDYYIKDAM